MRSGEHAERGSALVKILAAMALFAIGIASLTQMQFATARHDTATKMTSTARFLAADRLEEMMYATAFTQITPENFPAEDYGDIANGDARYAVFKRQVVIADSQDTTGTVSMKTLTVCVAWRGPRGERNVELTSHVMR